MTSVMRKPSEDADARASSTAVDAQCFDAGPSAAAAAPAFRVMLFAGFRFHAAHLAQWQRSEC